MGRRLPPSRSPRWRSGAPTEDEANRDRIAVSPAGSRGVLGIGRMGPDPAKLPPRHVASLEGDGRKRSLGEVEAGAVVVGRGIPRRHGSQSEGVFDKGQHRIERGIRGVREQSASCGITRESAGRCPAAASAAKSSGAFTFECWGPFRHSAKVGHMAQPYPRPWSPREGA